MDSWLKKLNIEHLKGKYCMKMSGGELQLVYLAKALIQDAQVMLMDEPCTYLDIHKQHVFMEKINEGRGEKHSYEHARSPSCLSLWR